MKLLFVGDVMLGRLVNQALKARPPEYPWGNTLDVFRSADVRFCNLECSLSDRGVRRSPETKAFHFRSDAGNVEVLKRAGIDAVSLAKNHILDFDETALTDTLDILDRNRICHGGAGRNAAGASAPAALRIGDTSFWAGRKPCRKGLPISSSRPFPPGRSTDSGRAEAGKGSSEGCNEGSFSPVLRDAGRRPS